MLNLDVSLESFFKLLLKNGGEGSECFMSKFDFYEVLCKFSLHEGSLIRNRAFSVFDFGNDGLMSFEDFERVICGDVPNLSSLSSKLCRSGHPSLEKVPGQTLRLFKRVLECVVRLAGEVVRIKKEMVYLEEGNRAKGRD